MKIIAIFVLAIVCFSNLYAQNFNIEDGHIKAMSGMFYDSGGRDGKYLGGEDYIWTIENSLNQTPFAVRFEQFLLAEGDWLAVYNGESIDSPLIDIFSNNNPASGSINANGSALTFVFHSEQGNSAAGWVAKIESGKKSLNKSDGIVLRYKISGIKSKEDGKRLCEKIKSLDYVLNSEIFVAKQSLYVTTLSEEYTYKIKDFIIDMNPELGGSIEIDFIGTVTGISPEEYLEK